MFILHDNPMVGIYRIKNLVNNKCYYGSSKEVRKRYTLMSEDEKNIQNLWKQTQIGEVGKVSSIANVVLK